MELTIGYYKCMKYGLYSNCSITTNSTPIYLEHLKIWSYLELEGKATFHSYVGGNHTLYSER